jgi:hypothetical protein
VTARRRTPTGKIRKSASTLTTRIPPDRRKKVRVKRTKRRKIRKTKTRKDHAARHPRRRRTRKIRNPPSNSRLLIPPRKRSRKNC